MQWYTNTNGLVLHNCKFYDDEFGIVFMCFSVRVDTVISCDGMNNVFRLSFCALKVAHTSGVGEWGWELGEEMGDEIEG